MESTSRAKIILSSLVSFILMFFEPYVLLIKAIGILVIIDIVTGIMAARKEGKDITSKSLFTKIPKVGLFLIALAAAKMTSPLLLEFGIEAHQAGKWLCSFYGVYEFVSILENLGRLDMPVAKQFLLMLKSKLPDDVKEVVEEPKEEKT